MTTLLTSTSDFVLTVLLPLVDEAPEEKEIHTGWWYLVVIASLIVAMVFLWRSMRKQMSKIQFDETTGAPAPEKRSSTGHDG